MSGPWRLARASAIGSSHLRSATPCQDSSAIALIDSPAGTYLTAIVADGAGSAEHSQHGSRIVCDQLLKEAESFLASGLLLSDLTREEVILWVERAVDRLQTAASDASARLRDFACTVLVGIVGDADAAFFQVGDGAIVVSAGPDDGWSYVFWPQHGEYANTTNFVVSPDLHHVLEFDWVQGHIEEVALFTDGIENLVLHAATKSVHSPFFEGMIRPVRALEFEGESQTLSIALHNYLCSPPVCARTDDDKTLILATRLRLSSND